MIRSLAMLIGAAAIYGFAIGSAHSWLYAARNLVKFPLLLLTTAAICSLAYFVLARFLATRLPFWRVQELVLGVFRDLAVLLASLSPAVLFLALTYERPRGSGLGEYPLFQGLNIAWIALCGCLAVYLRARNLRTELGQQRLRNHLLLGGWMALSLFAGGQCCWYMRPFFGIPGRGSEAPPFFRGTEPDLGGARSFYEAVYHLISPPPEGR